MGTLFVPARDIALNALIPSTGYLSAHSGTPDSSGSFEIAGVDRVAVTFSAVANGIATISAPVVLSIPGGSTVQAIGLWDDTGVEGLIFYGFDPISPETYGVAGTMTINGQLGFA